CARDQDDYVYYYTFDYW
nr:immunoglobulin heavy chain junction region [Macaca mulatta]